MVMENRAETTHFSRQELLGRPHFFIEEWVTPAGVAYCVNMGFQESNLLEIRRQALQMKQIII